MELRNAPTHAGCGIPTLLDEADRRLVAAIQEGLPLVHRPYAVIAERIGLSEPEVIRRIAQLQAVGTVRRMGVIVRHHELGYRANAMVVWDIPDAEVDSFGACLGSFDFVTLCYRRPRRLPEWRYNLFTMIHGRDRTAVLSRVEELVERCGLQAIPHEVLFSRRRFKQRGARYRRQLPSPAAAMVAG